MSIEFAKSLIRDVPDFPKPGIVFKDITPLLTDHDGFTAVIDALAERYADAGITSIAGIESRGFIFGAPLAQRLGVGLLLVRKPGKLPAKTIGQDYDLEYGSDRVEIHADQVAPGDKVLVVDDLLATGGTAGAAVSLIRKMGAEVHEVAVVIELGFLDGRAKLDGADTFSLIQY